MDRKNGGDPLAPPRPPKLLPRVHRPRAPEPAMMMSSATPLTPAPVQQQHLLHPHQIRTINNNNNNNNLSISPTPLISLHSNSSSNNNNNNNNLSRNNSNLSSFTRRRPPPLTPTATTTATTTPLHSQTETPGSPVTLAAPRPENERLANEYVDTPFRAPTTVQQLQNASRTQHPAGQTIHGQTTTQHNLLQHQRLQHQQQQQHHSSHHSSSSSNNNAPVACDVISHHPHPHHHNHHLQHPHPASTLHSNTHSPKDISSSVGLASVTPPASTFDSPRIPQPITQPITKQPSAKDGAFALTLASVTSPPASTTFYPDESSSAASMSSSLAAAADSPSQITCPQCKRCRCEECQKPRPLPSTWICNKTCLCSAETVIDYSSCLCCVKALFYHCSRDHEMPCDDDGGGESISCADYPCSCLPHRRTARWGWLGAVSLVLPCLWCYWPMRGCVAVCAKCYGRNAREGCRCRQHIGSTSSMLPIAASVMGGGNGLGLKASGGVSGGVHSGISGSHHHSHHGGGGASRIIRKCDLTPEKRLLDSSPEY